MSDSTNQVSCDTHGSGAATFICQHLLEGEGKGFHQGFDQDNPDDLYPDAWCDACNDKVDAEGGWTKAAEEHANVKIVCPACYEAIRERQWVEDKRALDDLIATSCEWAQERQQTFIETFRIKDHPRWDWNQDDGELVFSRDGVPKVTASISFSGSFSSKSNAWLWAWANHSLSDNIKSASRAMRELGDESGFMKLAAAHWSAAPEDGWEMTSIMAKHLGAVGVYRTPSESGFTYMVIHTARWVDPEA